MEPFKLALFINVSDLKRMTKMLVYLSRLFIYKLSNLRNPSILIERVIGSPILIELLRAEKSLVRLAQHEMFNYEVCTI